MLRFSAFFSYAAQYVSSMYSKCGYFIICIHIALEETGEASITYNGLLPCFYVDETYLIESLVLSNRKYSINTSHTNEDFNEAYLDARVRTNEPVL